MSQKSREIKLPKPKVSNSSRVINSKEKLKRIKEKEDKKEEEMKAKEKRNLVAKKKEKLGIKISVPDNNLSLMHVMLVAGGTKSSGVRKQQCLMVCYCLYLYCHSG